jgi:hypothetical protein
MICTLGLSAHLLQSTHAQVHYQVKSTDRVAFAIGPRDLLGDSNVVGDSRWAGSWGIRLGKAGGEGGAGGGGLKG